jgi:hypothetical protein
LNGALVDRVFLTRFEDEVIVDDATTRAKILDELGYAVADNLTSDLIILIEGPSDRPVIEHYLIKMGLYADYNIKLWALGGDIMDQHNLSVFIDKYSIIGLIDNDPGSKDVRRNFRRMCRALGIPCVQLSAYSIENYFSVGALREVFKTQIKEEITTIDPNIKLEEQIGIDVKRNNEKLAAAMNLKEIEGTDLHRFLLRVEKMCRIDKKPKSA